MTVAELRKVLLNMDQNSEVLLNDPHHFMRKHSIARVEEGYTNSFDKPPIVLVAQEAPWHQ